MDALIQHSGNAAIRDTSKDMKPDPCPDCGRTYPAKESVQVNVDGRSEPIWVGCIDCWIIRTNPAHPGFSVETKEP